MCRVPLVFFIYLSTSFRDRFTCIAKPRCIARFLERFKGYVDAVGRETERRKLGRVLDLESFISERRENSAVRFLFSLIEYALDIDLPDQVFKDPNFIAAYFAGVDLVWLANVSCSLQVVYCLNL